MSQETPKDDIIKKTSVYQIPGMQAVPTRKDVRYRSTDAGDLTMDIYYPPDSKRGALTPAVLIVAGYPDPGYQTILGRKFKDMGSSVSWGQLIAASGLIAITYENREPNADLQTLLHYLRQNSAALGIDGNRISLWANSGNVPLALSVLTHGDREHLKCAVLCYGYMLDLEGPAYVSEAAKRWGFANPAAGRSVDDLPKGLPLFVVRAGQDKTPHLNETIDHFLIKALESNLPITFANHASAPHAFDLFHDSEASRQIIAQILDFMRFHLMT